MAGIPKDRDRLILDIGCGRGGTANYIQKNGWGKVTGLDIDEISIEYAIKAYPEVKFIPCSIYDASKPIKNHFDLICLFNSFYAFEDQSKALQELRMVIRQGGFIIISDYSDLAGGAASLKVIEDSSACWQPIMPKQIEETMIQSGWKLSQMIDVSVDYLRWYESLAIKIHSREGQIMQLAGNGWYWFILNFYSSMRVSIKDGQLRGTIITAVTA